MPSYTLERHANFHREISPRQRKALIGTFKLIETPPVDDRFPFGKYGAGTIEGHQRIWGDGNEKMRKCLEWSKNYVEDLSTKALDPFMWSVFAERFQSTYQGNTYHEETKINWPSGLTHPHDCHLKNDSFLREDLMTINGMDEDFDGCHNYQDTEIASRLSLNGTKFYLQSDLTVSIVDVHHLMTIRKIKRQEVENLSLFHSKLSTIYPTIYANPQINIKVMKSVDNDVY